MHGAAAANLSVRVNATPQRADYAQQSPELLKKFIEFLATIRESSIEGTIRDLVAVRTARRNGCAFCLDMHVKQARTRGERELRLYHLARWRDSTLFTPREHVALAWTEIPTKLQARTRLGRCQVRSQKSAAKLNMVRRVGQRPCGSLSAPRASSLPVPRLISASLVWLRNRMFPEWYDAHR